MGLIFIKRKCLEGLATEGDSPVFENKNNPKRFLSTSEDGKSRKESTLTTV
jgi:hypothetical protein